MNQIIYIILPAILTAASASFSAEAESFSVVYGDCYGHFHFTDRKSQEYCKPNISERQCTNLVEHYEVRFREKYKSFYHANLVLDATSTRRGCGFSKSFPK